MDRKRNKKKPLSLLLAITLVLSLSTTVFASWNQFQGNDSHNGILGVPPLTTEPQVTPVDLPNSAAWSGIDAENLIRDGYIYTLYNGGNDGARLQKTHLIQGTCEWNVCLNGNSLNVAQLSTPYMDGANLYAATTHYGILSPDGAVQLDGETVEPSNLVIPTGISSLEISGYNLPSDYRSMQIDTGINTESQRLSASAVMQTPTGYDYELGASSSWGGEFIMYNTNNYRVPEADGYKLIITFQNDTGSPLHSSGIHLLIPSWELYKVNTANGENVSVAYGRGQANSPISADANNIYFGIYDGDHCYYQFPKNGASISNLVPYIPQDTEADFYNAGAAIVSVNGISYAVFGCDNGKLYVRPTSDFRFGSGNIITLTSNTGYPTGPVRSSIVVSGESVYFSSKGENVGLVWRIPLAELTSSAPEATSNYVKEAENSTSTPVISESGILYVGTSYFDDHFQGHGTVYAYHADTLENITAVYEGDAVQASPIVYNEDGGRLTTDYVYFTTNSAAGAGFCCSLSRDRETGAFAVEQQWRCNGTSTNRNSLQGFSADQATLVYGDDGNRLYIMR